MILKITQKIIYEIDGTINFGFNKLLLTPQSNESQKILNWKINIEGGSKELNSIDQFGNLIDLVSIQNISKKIEYNIFGKVETKSSFGIKEISKKDLPLWCYIDKTYLTKPGEYLSKFYKENILNFEDLIGSLHELSFKIKSKIKYKKGKTDYKTTAEDAFKKGFGVCQDHTHIFLSIVRMNNLPCRYVSGLFKPIQDTHNLSMHAWAEVFIENLGWIGFDISNGISPDDRYVEIAKGFDYNDVVPVKGVINGYFIENQNLELSIDILNQ
mgnify:FL=1